MSNQHDRRFSIPATVLCQEVHGEMVLFDTSSQGSFGLDRIGARVWSGLRAGIGLRAIMEGLERDYDVGRDTLESDINSLIAQLLQMGLLEERA